MRKQQLRQHVNHYLHYNHRGSHQLQQRRRYVLHKIICDLPQIDAVIPKWHALTRDHLQQLVWHWQQHYKPATVMNYLTILREFLQVIGHRLLAIDNCSLGVINDKPMVKTVNVPIPQAAQWENPLARILFEWQSYFGLTRTEAMRLIPELHIQSSMVWVTRNIASNSQDRFIPIEYDNQRDLIQLWLTHCPAEQNLLNKAGYAPLRWIYQQELKRLGLPSTKSYRYLYAQYRYQKLHSILPRQQVLQLIHREMGIQSRMTLWNYLHE